MPFCDLKLGSFPLKKNISCYSVYKFRRMNFRGSMKASITTLCSRVLTIRNVSHDYNAGSI